MKVLHVYKTWFPDTQGGLEEVIRQVCAASREHGVESRVFALSRNPEPARLVVDGIEVSRARQVFELASCGFCLGGIRDFRRETAWADVIHYHFPWPFADVMHLLVSPRTPSMATYHSDIVRQRALQFFYRPVMNRFLASMSRIVATSPNYVATSRVLRELEGQVDIVPIGIEESTYPADHQLGPALEQVERECGDGFFLFVGVLRYYKGLHVLLEAMQDANYKAVIVGTGPVEKSLRRRARSLGLDNVIFLGGVTDEVKMALFRRCLGVVFPSSLRAEAFGVTLLEGAMSSRPLVTTETGTGTSLVNIDGETGLVIEPGCPRALREAMDFLHYNPGRANQMGANARARYRALFTGRTMGARYAEIYRQVAGAWCVAKPGLPVPELLRIAVDARPLAHPHTGIGRYTESLLRRLVHTRHQWFLYSDRVIHPRFALGERAQLRMGNCWPGSPMSLLYTQVLFPRWALGDCVDVFWSPRHHLPLRMPRSVRRVVTVHDLVWKRYPETMRPRSRLLERRLAGPSLERADRIIAVSRFTAAEIARHYPACEPRCAVAAPAAEPRGYEYEQEFPPLASEYLLFVGTPEPRKNLPRLLRAWRQVVEQVSADLVLVGGNGWGPDHLERDIDALGLRGRVHCRGQVSDAELQQLYGAALGLVLPSLYEGFGLPVLEAMCHGVPVIVSDRSALPEVAGDAGLLVNPESVDSIAGAMLELCRDGALRRRLSGNALDRAAEYNWDRSAALTLAELERAVDMGGVN